MANLVVQNNSNEKNFTYSWVEETVGRAHIFTKTISPKVMAQMPKQAKSRAKRSLLDILISKPR